MRALLKPEILTVGLRSVSAKTNALVVPSTKFPPANYAAGNVLEAVTVLPAKTLVGLPEPILSAWLGVVRRSVLRAAPRMAIVALAFIIGCLVKNAVSAAPVSTAQSVSRFGRYFDLVGISAMPARYC